MKTTTLEVYRMSYGRITDKQREILEYIKKEILNRGYPPTVRDICEAVNLKSTSSVHSHLETLEKNGYIRRDPTKPRAIEIVDDNFNLTRREFANVPLIGQVAAGVRRIKALTGMGVLKYINGMSAVIMDVCSLLKIANPKAVVEGVQKAEQLIKEQQREINELNSKLAVAQIGQLFAGIDIQHIPP